jgi:hypothetical protein
VEKDSRWIKSKKTSLVRILNGVEQLNIIDVQRAGNP